MRCGRGKSKSYIVTPIAPVKKPPPPEVPEPSPPPEEEGGTTRVVVIEPEITPPSKAEEGTTTVEVAKVDEPKIPPSPKIEDKPTEDSRPKITPPEIDSSRPNGTIPHIEAHPDVDDIKRPTEEIRIVVIPPSSPAPTQRNSEARETSDTSDISRNPSDSSYGSVNGLTDRKESLGVFLDGSRDSVQKTEQGRRPGIELSAEANVDISGDETLPVHQKSIKDQEEIKKAIEKNEFLSKILTGARLQDVINAMELKTVPAKKTLIKQGDKGTEMYVSIEGKFRIFVKSKLVGEFSDSRVFGELAILYNAKRFATVQAATAGKVWVLNRQVYQKITIISNLKEQDENLRFLQQVKSLEVVEEPVLRQVSNLLKREFFSPGTVIIKQGDRGDKFYIICAGTVTVSTSGQGTIGNLTKGQCFGEKALQKEDTRMATVTANAPGVECLTLTRKAFTDHFGDVDIPMIPSRAVSLVKEFQSEYQHVQLKDLIILKTLGVGGFGRVELVQFKKQKTLVFALKYLKKIDIVRQNQQEHVYNEKHMMSNCKSPFITKLYKTYKDNKYVYFLLEFCVGGDLFSLLHRQTLKRFEEEHAIFLSACVLEAIAHLHSKGIVYRDLKPENLVIDKNGYLKLTDFGFAKQMPTRGKTFTFAGTPEYVAPEIVLNRGHDRAVDYWAFGIIIFELLTGHTPFRTNDPSHMKTYNKILNGIDNVNFPTYFSLKAKNLVQKLCRPASSERLGMQRGGFKDIKSHKWYQGLDWQKLENQTLPSPFKPKVKDFIDTKYFDSFQKDKDFPAEETSGWDIDF